MKKYLKYLLIGLPLLGGIIISFFIDFNIYNDIALPPLAPPKILFPIVWSIIYLLMGIVLYKIKDSDENVILFVIQLLFNYLWSFIFFNARMFLGSLIIIIILDLLVIFLIVNLRYYDKLSSNLLIPYLIWILFASYLNFAIYLLN